VLYIMFSFPSLEQPNKAEMQQQVEIKNNTARYSRRSRPFHVIGNNISRSCSSVFEKSLGLTGEEEKREYLWGSYLLFDNRLFPITKEIARKQ